MPEHHASCWPACNASELANTNSDASQSSSDLVDATGYFKPKFHQGTRAFEVQHPILKCVWNQYSRPRRAEARQVWQRCFEGERVEHHYHQPEGVYFVRRPPTGWQRSKLNLQHPQLKPALIAVATTGTVDGTPPQTTDGLRFFRQRLTVDWSSCPIPWVNLLVEEGRDHAAIMGNPVYYVLEKQKRGPDDRCGLEDCHITCSRSISLTVLKEMALHPAERWQEVSLDNRGDWNLETSIDRDKQVKP